MPSAARLCVLTALGRTVDVEIRARRDIPEPAGRTFPSPPAQVSHGSAFIERAEPWVQLPDRIGFTECRSAGVPECRSATANPTSRSRPQVAASEQEHLGPHGGSKAGRAARETARWPSLHTQIHSTRGVRG